MQAVSAMRCDARSLWTRNGKLALGKLAKLRQRKTRQLKTRLCKTRQ